MDNQQPRSQEERVQMLCKNAKLGDGYLWKHPECKNYKLIFTSTTPELLLVKQNIAPEIFKSGIRGIDLSRAKGRFPNARPLHRLASIVHPLATQYKAKSYTDVIGELTLDDMALWYLDDGSTIARKDSEYGYTRSYLCVGSKLPTDEDVAIFLDKIKELYGVDNVGTIRLNGSSASDNNKIWNIPTEIAQQILECAAGYSVLKHKFPSWIRFRDHSHGEVESKGKSTRSTRVVDIQQDMVRS